MLQVGTIGLIKAIGRYDVSRGGEFTTPAVQLHPGGHQAVVPRHHVVGARAPARLQELPIELARAREQLEGQGVHEPFVIELATHLDLDEAEVAEGVVASNVSRSIS